MAKERRVSRTVLLVTAATSTVLDEMPPECVATSDAKTRQRAPQRAKELPFARTQSSYSSVNAVLERAISKVYFTR